MQEAKLDQSQIVHAALDLIKSEGLDAFSMRRLGSRLHIRAPTLYWYFPDRSSILRAVIKTLLVETIDAIPATKRWQDWMVAFGVELWRTNRDTPFVPLLLQSTELNNDEIFSAAAELLDGRLRESGLPRSEYLPIHSDIQAFVLGWAVFYHAGVTDRLQNLVDTDMAVRQGIAGIVSVWEARLAERKTS